jgi:hypothetical protein
MKKVLFFFLAIFTAVYSQNITLNIYDSSNPDSMMLNFAGVISGPLPCYQSEATDLTEKLREIGVTSIRNNGYMDDRLDMERMFDCLGDVTSNLAYYPNWKCSPEDTNNYHFEASDTLFNSIVGSGFDLMFRVGGEVQCAIRLHDYEGPRSDEEDNYIEAAKYVVNHYLHLNGSRKNFEYLNLWTEYPNKTFWDRDAGSFNSFWRRMFESLKAEYPQLKIGGPGFLVAFDEYDGSASNYKVKNTIDFLDTLYQAGDHPDWLGFHFIRNDIIALEKNIVNFKKLLNGESPFDDVPWKGSGFFDNTEIICDAYMFSPFNEDSSGNTVYLTRQQVYDLVNCSKASAYQTAYWIILKRNGIERSYWYRAGDQKMFEVGNPSAPTDGVPNGLFWGDSAGTPKKLAYGFRLQTTLAREGFVHYLNIPDQYSLGLNDSLWALAAEKDSNNFAVLISNVSATQSKSVDFTLNGEQIVRRNYDIKFAIVDENSDGLVWKSLPSNKFTIPEFGVVLLKFSRKVLKVENEKGTVSEFDLEQNYPNPFGSAIYPGNTTTTINYQINKSSNVLLTVYNVLGEKVATLVKKRQGAGNYSVTFDASRLSSGMYFFKIKAGKFVAVKKMQFIK